MCSACESKSRLHANPEASKGTALSVSSSDLGESSLLNPAGLQGVTQPPATPAIPSAKFGFVENAERINSRAAMVRLLAATSGALQLTLSSRCYSILFVLQIGFFALIAVEVILGRGLLETVGLRVGNGLPFEL